MSIIKTVKALLPKLVLHAYRQYRVNTSLKEYKNLTTQKVFEKIYADGAWGLPDNPSHKFYSGTGSHDETIISTYIEAVSNFLTSFKTKPNVVDLGCGDFFVGSKIRFLCGNYTACDIVADLIEFNQEIYNMLNVDFKVLDLTTDELPSADIVFIRQVLQHLSNDQIASSIHQITSKYKFLILSEHLPNVENFVHNIDKPAGPSIRTSLNSGIVLTSPPFNLKVKSESLLCEVNEYGGVIRTTLYSFE